ncbi:transposase [Cupriavidus basilensis]
MRSSPCTRRPPSRQALAALEAFEQEEWGKKYPPIAASWRRAWDQVIPFFMFPPAIRKIILHDQRH